MVGGRGGGGGGTRVGMRGDCAIGDDGGELESDGRGGNGGGVGLCCCAGFVDRTGGFSLNTT
jgi:hypothetical protein